MCAAGAAQHQHHNHGNTEQDSFLHFCNTQHLPSNANILIKQAFYYLSVIGENPALLWQSQEDGSTTRDEQDENMTEQQAKPIIIAPDMQALKAFIAEIHHVGAPGTSLRMFKEKCIPTGYNWSTVLRLYLAAYCKPVAKDLWLYVIAMIQEETNGALSQLCGAAETEMNTQRYVAQTPFDARVIMDVIHKI